jgi:SMI1-KNR4 cell-wall
MSSISYKLNALGLRPMKADVHALQNSNYSALLAEKGFLVPNDYQTFLLDHPLTGVFDNQIVFSGKDTSPWATNGLEVLEVLYGQCSDTQNDLLKVCDQLSNQLPLDFLPIGQVTGANFVCLCLRKESFGEVYVWDHEHDNDVRQGLYFVTSSFSEFVNLLHEAKVKPSMQASKLIKMEISDSMKKRVNELITKKK